MARSLPYSEGVPGVLPTQQPPDDYQRIPTANDQFGGAIARGTEQLGQGAVTAGKFFDEIAATQAANNYEDETTKLLFGDPGLPGDKGFYGLKGQDAVEAMPRVRNRLLELRGQIRDTLANGDQALHYEARTSQQQMRLLSEIGRHFDREQNIWGSNVNDATYSNAIASIAARPEDDENFAAATGRAIEGKIKNVILQGGANSPELVEQAQRAGRQGAVEARIEALLPTNPGKAQQVLQQEAGLLKGPLYDRLNNALQSKATNALGDDLLRTAQGNGSAAVAQSGASGDLWQRVKGAEGGVGANGEALVSPKGAIGVSQILPDTARDMATKLGLPYDERRLHTDRDYNERLGKAYLDEQLERYGGNHALAAAAYNAGPQRVDDWLKTIGDPRTGAISEAEFARRIPIAETRDYVGGILAKAGPTPGPQVTGTGAPVIPAAAHGAPVVPSFDLAGGDSLAAQQLRHGVPGKEGIAVSGQNPTPAMQQGETAAVGESPERVFARLQNNGTETYAGKTVLWSSGASNARDPQTHQIDPARLAPVEQQLDFLKNAGASGVAVLPVGPGVANQADVNAKLKQIAEARGFAFVEPGDLKWQQDGIHPAEVDKLRGQAQQALAASPPDTVAGATGATRPAAPIPSTPGQSPPSAAVPAPPGMTDLANAEAELAQRHARVIANLNSDPRAAANPTALAHAVQKADLDFRSRQMAITAQKQALTEARNAAADQYVQRMMKGPVDSTIVQQIADDGHLDTQTRENLWRLYEAHTKNGIDGDIAKYGPKFFDYYQRVTAKDDDPARLRDPSQLFALAQPKPDGSQDLTLAGVDKLSAELRARKSPERVGDSDIQKGALAYGKHQLSFEADYGYFKIPDPKGVDAFNIGFLPAFFKYYESGIAAGKSPAELVAKEKLDALIAPFKRSEAELLRDRIQAGETANQGGNAAKAGPPPEAVAHLQAHPELRGAFEQKYGAGSAAAVLGVPAPPASVTPPVR